MPADTFMPTYRLASEFLDELASETGIPPERTVLGGFSQGSMMSYALGLGADRPRPAGIVALSGFFPQVEGLDIDVARPLPPDRHRLRHLRPDHRRRVGSQARELLEQAGADVLYREYPYPHAVDPSFLAEPQTLAQERDLGPVGPAEP